MAVRFELDNAPEFYTNLDKISGQIVIQLNRPEQVGSIVVKLEGEAITGIRSDSAASHNTTDSRQIGVMTSGPLGNSPVVTEKHKVLYQVQQVFPDDYHASMNNPYGAFPLQVGRHAFPFEFKMPINNICSNPEEMARLGITSLTSNGMFGSRVRVMDGTRQLYLRHVTQTLPPSLTNFNGEAEIRYYLKVTVQRPGFLKENWRHMRQFKFLPIEPPREPPGGQEAFARRPFTFKGVSADPQGPKKKTNFLGMKKTGKDAADADADAESAPPQSIEVSARLPHPPVLTCNRPVPLRILVKKLVNNPEQVYLTSFQLELIGTTLVRAQNGQLSRENSWFIASNTKLDQPLFTEPKGDIGTEVVIPDDLWSRKPLPNTVSPSFVACNVIRRYQLKLLIGLRLGKPRSSKTIPETIILPLHFPKVDVFSGIPPPRELLKPNGTNPQANPTFPPRPSVSGVTNAQRPPNPRPNPQRPNAQRPNAQSQNQPPLPARPETDPLYPPQLQPGETGAGDAPPSYSEALADGASPMFDSEHPRPPYSGVTDENAPSAFPQEKR